MASSFIPSQPIKQPQGAESGSVYISVIPATQEAEIGGWQVSAYLGDLAVSK